jgi:hypothetical protein
VIVVEQVLQTRQGTRARISVQLVRQHVYPRFFCCNPRPDDNENYVRRNDRNRYRRSGGVDNTRTHAHNVRACRIDTRSVRE